MVVYFPPELELKVTNSAAQQGRNPKDLVQEVLTRYFEQEGCLIEAVKSGEQAFERGEYLTHEQVGQRLQRFFPS